MRDVIEVYTEVANKVKDVSDTERIAVVEGLAGKYHISRMQALLDDLGSVDSMYRSMYQTSKDSAGSAMKENEVYMKSLEARINLTRVEFEKLAVATGNAFLTEGMISFLQLASSGLGTISKLVDGVGALPLILGTAGMATFLLSTRFKTLSVSVGSTIISLIGFRGATVATTTATNLLTASTRGLGIAFKGLIASTGVGIPLVLIGIAIEKVMSAMGDARQKAEELESANKEMLNSYSQNADTIGSLVDKYEELNKIQQNGELDNTQLAEYRDIQNEIATLMPSLVTGEDKYGNKLIGSAEYIRIKTDLLKEQLAVEKEKAQLEETTARNERISANEDSLKGSKKDVKQTLSSFTNEVLGTNMERMIDAEYKIKFVDEKGNPLLKTTDALSKQLVEIQEKRKLAEADGNTDVANYYKSLEDSAKRYLKQLNESDLALRQSSASLKGDYVSSVEQAISANESLSESVKQSANELVANLISASSPDKVVKLHDTLSTIFNDLNADELTKDVISSFDNINKATTGNFDEMASKAKSSIGTLKEALTKDGTLTNSQINAVIKALNNELSSTTAEFKKLPSEVKETNSSFEEMKARARESSEEMEESSESIQKQVEKLKELSSAQEQIVGVSEAQIKAVTDSATVIEFLGNVSERTEQQEQSLANSISLLSALYPQLTNLLKGTSKQREQAIAIIESENKANQALLKAYELTANGKMNAEGRATMVHLEETNKRINTINAEIRALDVLQSKYNETINKRSNTKTAYSDTDLLIQERLSNQASSKITNMQAELATLSGTQTKYTESLQSTNTAIVDADKSTKKATESKKKENKETEKSIYLADLYKRKLDELNLAIQKEISLREKLPDHDAKFTSSLQTQLKLENEKLATMKAQEQSINAQIKAGKIQTTGMVKQSEAVKTTTKKLGGFQGRITSKFGERADNHRGTDIASAKGTGIDSFAGGKVIAAGYAGKKGAEKMHSSYGNVVVVQSDDGTKRLYAHMEKVLVKVGQQIDAGARIGTVGSTGNSTGPHLHYEKTQNGKLVDSYGEVAQARKGVTTTSGGTTEVQEVAQNVDQAKSDLIGIQNDILAQEKAIYELQVNMVDASLSGFEQKKSNYDKFLENNDNRLNKLTKSSQAYRDEMVKSSDALKAKKSVNQAEIEQLKKFIDSGTLTAKVVEEYTERLHELGKLNSEIDFSLKDINTSELESYVELVDELLSKYDKQRNSKDVSIDYDTVVLEELDKSTNKYLKSLEKINSTMKEKQTINRHELNSLEQLITNGKLYGDALDNAKDRVNELKKEIKQLQLDIQEGNFNIIVNVKTQSDSKVDDLQFEIDRAEAIRKMYEEGSADYTAYTQKIIEASKKMAEQHLKTRDALVEELKQRDITIERRKEILELLEDEHMAYLNATLATKDYVKQQQDAVESQRKAIADKVVDAYKSYVQERKDEHMKMLDDEMDRENKKHEKAMKQLNDEMDLYRKNVDEKLRLIDRQEADRDYNMDIADMEKERSKVQSEIDRLSMDNSNEAKSKRKKLQEQLEKIDKDIAEKRHDRDIELQKQGLNDLLETKEEEINGKIELQDKELENVLNKIEREKKYWDKHYTDLLNDERKFAQMREDIMNGHFDKVQAEFQEYIQQMIDTMPLLEDSMDGTMNAVGTSIRQNVIDSLREAMNMVNEFNSMQIGSGGFNDGIGSSGGIGDIVGDAGLGGSSGGSGGQPQGKLVSDADLKVIMAKYMTDVLASQYNDVRAANIREKAHGFAREGRAEGASIPSDSHYNTELAKLSKEDKIRLGNLASSNSSVFDSTEMQNAIKRWASSLKNRASALSGGMTSWSGNGIDGKGGKEMIVHPNELINSPLDTKNLLDMSNVMQRAMQFFTPVLNTIARPASLMNNISSTSGGDTYEIIFTGDINNTSKTTASQFAKDIMSEIRTKKGGRF